MALRRRLTGTVVKSLVNREGGFGKVNFGTDGWRGVIADDFTFKNVRLVSQAVCDYVLKEAKKRASHPSPPRGEDKGEGAEPTLIVGYDTRFLSDMFAKEAACVAAGNGINVLLTDKFAPTPAISYAVVDKQTDGAFMFTASHNPYRYNGLKFKAPYGGSASSQITGEIEHRLEENLVSQKKPALIDYDGAVNTGEIKLFDPKAPYLARLSELIDTDVIKKSGMGVVIDPMFGAGQGYLGDFLREAGCQVVEIRDRRDPYFGGDNPEPLGQHLSELTAKVTGVWPLGIALDGDADRIGAVDKNGGFISSHQIFSLLLRYLHKEKGLTGEIVKTVSTTGMIDLLAAEYGLTLHETPIGFKYICDRMLTGDVLIGGEESGGIGVKGHIPERDGMLMGALLVEMMNYYGKTLGELWTELEDKYGRFFYDRVDLEIDHGARSQILAFFRKFKPEDIKGVHLARLNDRDGFKYCLIDNSWLMIRPSGTEAVVRIYAEAESSQRVNELVEFGRNLVKEASK